MQLVIAAQVTGDKGLFEVASVGEGRNGWDAASRSIQNTKLSA